MSAATNYLEQKLLDHVSRIAAYTQPSGLTIGLSTTTPSDDGTNFTEPSGNGYAKETVAFSSDGQVGGAYQVSNSGALTFTASGGNWGTITYFGIFDTEGTPNLLSFAAMDTSRTINDGESLNFAIGSIKWTLN